MAKRVKGKLHKGARGGKYRVVSGRKVYVTTKTKAKRRVRAKVARTGPGKPRREVMAPVKPGDFPVNAHFRSACAKNEKRRAPDVYLQLLCRQAKTRGIVAKYRRIIAAIEPEYLAANDTPERIMDYWSLYRQPVGPYSASPAQEAEFVAYGRANGLRNEAATGEAIMRALAPKDAALLLRTMG
jgi:hypothetical protein